MDVANAIKNNTPDFCSARYKNLMPLEGGEYIVKYILIFFLELKNFFLFLWKLLTYLNSFW